MGRLGEDPPSQAPGDQIESPTAQSPSQNLGTCSIRGMARLQGMEYTAPGTVFWSHGEEPTTSLGCGIPGPGGVARLKRGSLRVPSCPRVGPSSGQCHSSGV